MVIRGAKPNVGLRPGRREIKMNQPIPATLAIISTANRTFQLNSNESIRPVSLLGKMDGRIILVKVWNLPALKTEPKGKYSTGTSLTPCLIAVSVVKTAVNAQLA